MGKITNYPIEFIKRTKEILQKDFHHFEEKDKEVTFLMNCLVGLIVTVSENENRKLEVFKGKIDDHFLALVPDKIGFVEKENPVDNNTDLIDKSVTKLGVRVHHKDDLKNKEKFWLLNKIRNGIAHLNIEWENDNGKCKNIRLWNEPRSGVIDFEIVFTIEELRKFAVELSNKYLTVKQKKTGQLAKSPEALFSM